MSLFAETTLLAVGIAGFSCLPLAFSQVRKHSKFFFLVGTGALFGLCFFDLLPDVFALGGTSSLYIIGIVWLIYSLAHLFHLHHHHHQHHESAGQEGSLPDCSLEDAATSTASVLLFTGSLMAHCFASGMLLTLSHELSARIANTVFLALVAHKGYEALMLSSVLVQQKITKLFKILVLCAYALSLPLGVVTTYLLKEYLSQNIAMMISSIAVGTLLGCLFFDFMIPSLRQMKRRKLELAWMVVGLLLTQLVMRVL